MVGHQDLAVKLSCLAHFLSLSKRWREDKFRDTHFWDNDYETFTKEKNHVTLFSKQGACFQTWGHQVQGVSLKFFWKVTSSITKYLKWQFVNFSILKTTFLFSIWGARILNLTNFRCSKVWKFDFWLNLIGRILVKNKTFENVKFQFWPIS